MCKTNQAKWYAIFTYSKYENAVESELARTVKSRNMQDLIVDIKIPKETVTQIKRGKTCTVEKVLFPQYVFVKMIDTNETRYIVKNVRGSYGLVSAGTEPMPLSDEEIAKFGVDKHSVKLGFKIGDRVNIINCPLKGYDGIVQKIDPENNSVYVLISSSGTKITAELELNQISLAS